MIQTLLALWIFDSIKNYKPEPYIYHGEGAPIDWNNFFFALGVSILSGFLVLALVWFIDVKIRKIGFEL